MEENKNNISFDSFDAPAAGSEKISDSDAIQVSESKNDDASKPTSGEIFVKIVDLKSFCFDEENNIVSISEDTLKSIIKGDTEKASDTEGQPDDSKNSDTNEKPEISEDVTSSKDDPAEAGEIKNKNSVPENKKQKMNLRATLFDWMKTFIISLSIVIFTFTFLVCGVTVDGESMNNTLQDRDYLLISKLFYTPETGDVIVLKTPKYSKGPLIKRVIGTSGQRIKINFNTWEVEVDGVLLDESYVLKQYSPVMNPENIETDKNGCCEFTVGEGMIFVMGDNRNNSLDSRSNTIGEIEECYVMGKVLWRILPFDSFGKVD